MQSSSRCSHWHSEIVCGSLHLTSDSLIRALLRLGLSHHPSRHRQDRSFKRQRAWQTPPINLRPRRNVQMSRICPPSHRRSPISCKPLGCWGFLQWRRRVLERRDDLVICFTRPVFPGYRHIAVVATHSAGVIFERSSSVFTISYAGASFSGPWGTDGAGWIHVSIPGMNMLQGWLIHILNS